MSDPFPPIRSQRLDLISVGPDFVEAAREGRKEEAERLAGVRLPSGWERDSENLLRLRGEQMREDPASQPWLLRLIVIRETGEMAGFVNFHMPPQDRGWVEIGYVIEPPFRRRGYALEAAMAMFLWAAGQGVERFRASVSPDNEPSLRMVAKMGFTRTGEQWDDIDGLEYVFEASLAELHEAMGATRGVNPSPGDAGADG